MHAVKAGVDLGFLLCLNLPQLITWPWVANYKCFIFYWTSLCMTLYGRTAKNHSDTDSIINQVTVTFRVPIGTFVWRQGKYILNPQTPIHLSFVDRSRFSSAASTTGSYRSGRASTLLSHISKPEEAWLGDPVAIASVRRACRPSVKTRVQGGGQAALRKLRRNVVEHKVCLRHGWCTRVIH